MPKVGSKHFPYTPQGKRNAQKYARATGQSMNSSYKRGGSLLSSLEGRLDMTMPGSINNKHMKGDCNCHKRMNMGGTVTTANTYSRKK